MVSGGTGRAAGGGAIPRRAIWVAVLAAVAIGAGLVWIFSDKAQTSTDDAYVRADETIVSPLVRGMILEVATRENQPVKAGDVLVRMDPEEFDLAIETAQGDIMAADAAEKAAKAGLARLDAEEKLSEDQVKGAEALAGKAGAADPALRQAFETARGQALIAVRSRGEIEADLSQAQAAQYRAHTELAAAKLEKAHTLVTAPASGIVADVDATPGAIVQPGVRLMTIVNAATPYLTANFKETQVGRMHPGEAAKVKVDALPGRIFTGHVDSLSPGSGSEFALLPFQPGTGNFTKIVQRVPVRIALDPGQPGLEGLRPGLSAEVTVDLERGG
jgi:membrane fusion protein (multidrug efflux system)